MRIVLGADHRGIELTRAIEAHLRDSGHDVRMLGQCTGNSCDYPDSAWLVGRAVGTGEADRGILVCGSGIGMSIAANKVAGVRAALVFDELAATMSRGHNDANVLCLSADLLDQTLVLRIADVWLKAEFEGGRHARRVGKIMAIERGEDPSRVSAPEAVG
jgi:ribose 5-phosphate isomerase B